MGRPERRGPPRLRPRPRGGVIYICTSAVVLLLHLALTLLLPACRAFRHAQPSRYGQRLQQQQQRQRARHWQAGQPPPSVIGPLASSSATGDAAAAVTAWETTPTPGGRDGAASIGSLGLSDPYAGPLQDLVESGVLTVIRRRPDYVDRKGSDYVEPEVIYLVATAHTSARSAEAVARVIQEVEPCSVILEMCKSRSGLTALNDSRLLEEVRFPTLFRTALFGAAQDDAALQRSLRLAGGRGGLFLQYCLTWAVKELASLLKVKFGEEFRAARAAAEAGGAQVVLGDRPIELTLRRAWRAMTPEERGAVLLAGAGLLLGFRPGQQQLSLSSSSSSSSLSSSSSSSLRPSGADPRGSGGLPLPLPLPLSPTDGASSSRAAAAAATAGPGGLEFDGYQGATDAVLQSLERFGEAFPSLFHALIGERDRYLAWACKRSKAVNGSKRVVAVMGALHLPGVVAALRQDNGGNTLTFKTVARLPEQEREAEAGGSGGVALSPGCQRLVKEVVVAWARRTLPHFLRDLALGTAAIEGLKLGYAAVEPDVASAWATLAGSLGLDQQGWPFPFL